MTIPQSAGAYPKRIFDDLPEEGFVRLADLVPGVLPMSKATIWRGVKDGTIPKPVKLSANCTAWKVADIRAWIKSRSEVGA